MDKRIPPPDRSRAFSQALADIRLAKTTAIIKKKTKCPQCGKLILTKNFRRHLDYHRKQANDLKGLQLIKVEEYQQDKEECGSQEQQELDEIYEEEEYIKEEEGVQVKIEDVARPKSSYGKVFSSKHRKRMQQRLNEPACKQEASQQEDQNSDEPLIVRPIEEGPGTKIKCHVCVQARYVRDIRTHLLEEHSCLFWGIRVNGGQVWCHLCPKLMYLKNLARHIGLKHQIFDLTRSQLKAITEKLPGMVKTLVDPIAMEETCARTGMLQLKNRFIRPCDLQPVGRFHCTLPYQSVILLCLYRRAQIIYPYPLTRPAFRQIYLAAQRMTLPLLPRTFDNVQCFDTLYDTLICYSLLRLSNAAELRQKHIQECQSQQRREQQLEDNHPTFMQQRVDDKDCSGLNVHQDPVNENVRRYVNMLQLYKRDAMMTQEQFCRLNGIDFHVKKKQEKPSILLPGQEFAGIISFAAATGLYNFYLFEFVLPRMLLIHPTEQPDASFENQSQSHQQ